MKKSCLLFLLAFLALGAPPDARKAGLDPARLAKIPTRMKEFVDRGELAGTVTLVARHGVVASLDAVGWQNVEEKKPMRTDSIFQIMSMTKPFTGVAIMTLVEEGKLRLSDPVEKFIPEFHGQMLLDSPKGGELKKPARPIRVHDLMTHTSGMVGPSGDIKDLYQKMNLTLAEAVAIYAKQPLVFEPGSKWQYCNVGIATLGRIVEVVSGQPFEKFLDTRIFQPLGMKDSFLFPPADKTARVALLYKSNKGQLARAGAEALGGDSALYRKGAKYAAPEFGLYSTASDLAAFYQMMLNGGKLNGRRILSPASVDVMTKVHTGDLKAGHMLGTGFGLTWEVVKEPIGSSALLSPGTFGHGGAFNTHGYIDKAKDMVGVFLTQSSGGTSGTDAKYAFMAMAASALE